MKKNIYLLLLLLMGFSASAQITGPSTISPHEHATYTFNNGTSYPSNTWNASGATNVKTTKNGASFTLTVFYPNAGSYTIVFLDNTYTPRGSFTVTVSGASCAPPNPVVSIDESGLCDSKDLSFAVGAAPNGVAWHWENNSTSYESNLAVAGVPYTVTANSTYYVRAKSTTKNCWSVGGSSRAVTVPKAPAQPGAPTINPATGCGTKTATQGTCPSGSTCYWQGKDFGGTSTAMPASTQLTITEWGDYYVRALSTEGCWSAPRGFVVTGDPPAPVTKNLEFCDWDNMVLTTVSSPYSNTLRWYDASDNLLFTGMTYPVELSVGSYTYKVRGVSGAGCVSQNSSVIVVTVGNQCDDYVNWQQHARYSNVIDGGGNPTMIESGRTYRNGGGEEMQSQAKDFVNDKILTTSVIRDKDNTAVINTLAAPLEINSFQFRHRFVTNSNNSRYKDGDFANQVATSKVGTLGWYYSTNNNIEPNTPVTGYPYIRTLTPKVPNPVTSSSAPAGEARRIGSGREEVTDKSVFPTSEITDYFNTRPFIVNSPSPYVATLPNLLSGVSFAATSAFTAYPSGTAVTASSSGESVTAICNPATVKTGLYPIGNSITVTPNATYSVRVRGIASANNFYIFITDGSGNTITPSSTQFLSMQKYGWTAPCVFKVPSGITTIKVGVVAATITGIQNFTLSEIELKTENNLLGGVIFSTAAAFTAYPSGVVTVSSNNSVITATCNASGVKTGLYPIGGTLTVTPNTTYTIRAKGVASDNRFSIWVTDGAGNTLGVYPSQNLPTINPNWTPSYSFKVPTGISSIKIGIVAPTVSGTQTLSITALELKTDTPPTGNMGYKFVTTDPDEKKYVEYQDASGLTLVEGQLVSGILQNPVYYYYNDIGLLLATVTPNGVGTSNGALNQPNFLLVNKYDQNGRIVETISPDAGRTQFIYSTDGKLRFSQNQLQANTNKFSYTNYDDLGRVVETGEYNMTGTDYYVFETQLVNTKSVQLIKDLKLPAGYDIETVKTSPNYPQWTSAKLDTRCLEYTFYLYGRSVGYTTDTNHPAQNNLYGQVSKTSTAQSTTWYSYSEFGQLEWTKQSLPMIGFKTTDYKYDYAGNVTQIAFQNSNSAEAFYHHYVYDKNMRLVQVLTSRSNTPNAATDLRAVYSYYLHGPMKRIEYMNGSEKIQGIDFVYNIDGTLKSINSGDPTKDPGADGITGGNVAFMPDVFGETIHYFDGDYAGAGYSAQPITFQSPSTNYYNGNIRAVSYNNFTGFDALSINNEKVIYTYQYDASNQLTDGQWGKVSNGTPVLGEAQREQVTGYDKNGNIQSLVRKGVSSQTIGNYTYHYQPNTNKLESVKENGVNVVSYQYNANGQVTEQSEKDQDGNPVIFTVDYTSDGLVKSVTRNSKLVMTYEYDDRGDLYRRIINNNVTGSLEKEVYYIHDLEGNVLAVYEKTATGSPTQVEVPVYGQGRLGEYRLVSTTPTLTYDYFYEVNDHLGNVRSLIGPPTTQSLLATMETTASEQPPFEYINPVRETNYPIAAVSGVATAMLDNNRANGPGILIQVSPGDKVDIDCWAYYDDPDATLVNSTLSTAQLVTAIATTFGGVKDAPGEPGRIYNRINAASSLLGSDNSNFDLFPNAGIAAIIYDNNFNPLFYSKGSVASGKRTIKQKFAVPQIKIEKPGYIYICIFNKSKQAKRVFFDDFKVTTAHSRIVSGKDYYPFGLALDASKISDVDYRFGYQGQFSEENKNTSWNEFNLRMYDARFARWMATDLYSQEYSPYVAMGNAPNMNVDPDGGFNISLPGRALIANAVFYGIAGGFAHLVMNPEDGLEGFAKGAAKGALTGAVVTFFRNSDLISGTKLEKTKTKLGKAIKKKIEKTDYKYSYKTKLETEGLFDRAFMKHVQQPFKNVANEEKEKAKAERDRYMAQAVNFNVPIGQPAGTNISGEFAYGKLDFSGGQSFLFSAGVGNAFNARLNVSHSESSTVFKPKINVGRRISVGNHLRPRNILAN